MTNAAESLSATAAAEGAVPGHVLSPSILIGVFAGLLALSAATVALAAIDLGSIVNLWLALAIAAAQAFLLALYFMRLRWDNPFHGVVLIAAVFFVALFIGIVVLDSKEYHPDLAPPTGVAPQP